MTNYIARLAARVSAKLIMIAVGLTLAPAWVVAQSLRADKQTSRESFSTGPLPRKQPLVHTYSIVARDPETGQLGMAVQSNWFSVDSMVTWAEAGVGTIATQSFVEPSYGALGLQLMRAGKSAPEALKTPCRFSNGSLRRTATGRPWSSGCRSRTCCTTIRS